MLNNIKSQYEKLEEKPSDLLWEKLEKKLNSEKEAQYIPLQQSIEKPNKWLRYAAIAVLLLTLANVIWMLSPKENQQKEIVKTIIQPQVKTATTENNSGVELVNKTQPTSSESQKIVQQSFDLKEKNEVFNPQIHLNNTNNSVLQSANNTQIEKKEELLALQTRPEKAEKIKYVSASDLLFSAELDNTKKEQQSTSSSKLGLNDLRKSTKDQNNFSPKSLKIFGITVYENDSLTQK